MRIPKTKVEFTKDIINTCGYPERLDNSSLSDWIDQVNRRISEYGVNISIHKPLVSGSIPFLLFGKSFKQEDSAVEKFIGRIWDNCSEVIIFANGLSIKDRNSLIGSSSVSLPRVIKWLAEAEESTEWNSGWFTNLPYHERKFIMPVRSLEDYQKNTPDIQRFRISHLPADIIFEDCIPTVGELYIAHPYRQGVYLPVSKYEHLIFRERIHELSKVMMALGATEIRTLQNSDSKSQSSSENSSNTSASVGVGRFGAKGTFSSFLKGLAENEKSDSIVINFKNDPIDLPRVPDGLIWYPHDKEWQHIADSRLYGNILEYEINLSSKEINLVSEIERNNIEAQAKAFFVSGSYSKDNSSHTFFKEESAKTTKIRIKFKSRKDY